MENWHYRKGSKMATLGAVMQKRNSKKSKTHFSTRTLALPSSIEFKISNGVLMAIVTTGIVSGTFWESAFHRQK
jgi:hypothetical protein